MNDINSTIAFEQWNEEAYHTEMQQLFSLYDEASNKLEDLTTRVESMFFEYEMDDTTLLAMEDAEEQVVNQKQSIFSKIVERIKALWNAIVGIFARKKKEIPPEELEEEIEIPEEAERDRTNILTFWKNLSTGVGRLKEGDVGGVSDLVKGLTIPSLLLIGGTLTGKHIKKKRSVAVQDTEQVSAIHQQITGILDKVTGILKMIPGVNKILSIISDFSGKVKSWVDKVWTFISSPVKKAASAIADKTGLGKKEDGDSNQGNEKNQKGKKKPNLDPSRYAASNEQIAEHEKASKRKENAVAHQDEFKIRSRYTNIFGGATVTKQNNEEKNRLAQQQENFNKKGKFLTYDLTKLVDQGKGHTLYTHQNAEGKFEYRTDGKWYQKYDTRNWQPYKGTPKGFKKSNAIVRENALDAWLTYIAVMEHDGGYSVFETSLDNLFGIPLSAFGNDIQDYGGMVLEFEEQTPLDLLMEL